MEAVMGQKVQAVQTGDWAMAAEGERVEGLQRAVGRGNGPTVTSEGKAGSRVRRWIGHGV